MADENNSTNPKPSKQTSEGAFHEEKDGDAYKSTVARSPDYIDKNVVAEKGNPEKPRNNKAEKKAACTIL